MKFIQFIVQARDVRINDLIYVMNGVGGGPPVPGTGTMSTVSFIGPSYEGSALQVYLDRRLKEDDIQGVFIDEYDEEHWVGSGGYGDFEIEPHDLVSVWRVV